MPVYTLLVFLQGKWQSHSQNYIWQTVTDQSTWRSAMCSWKQDSNVLKSWWCPMYHDQTISWKKQKSSCSNKETKNSHTNTDFTYLDPLGTHSTRVTSDEVGGEFQVSGELPPFPTARESTLHPVGHYLIHHEGTNARLCLWIGWPPSLPSRENFVAIFVTGEGKPYVRK